MQADINVSKLQYCSIYILALIFLGILVAGNFLFIYTHKRAADLLSTGIEMEAYVIRLVSEPGGGRRGYTYGVEIDGEVLELFFSTRQKVEEKITVLKDVERHNKYFIGTNSSTYLDVYLSMFGGWFVAVLINVLACFWVFFTVAVIKPLYTFLLAPFLSEKLS